MDQAHDRPVAEACAKWTLGGARRAGLMCLLLAGAMLASLLTIDIPVPAGWGADGSASYVPASDRWIDLGASSRPELPPFGAIQSDPPQRAAATDPVLAPSRDETRGQPPRKPSGAASNPRSAGALKRDRGGRFATDTDARRTAQTL